MWKSLLHENDANCSLAQTTVLCVTNNIREYYNYTRIIKNIFNKNERRCRDVKTQKACEQGWEANIGPKIKQTVSI